MPKFKEGECVMRLIDRQKLTVKTVLTAAGVIRKAKTVFGISIPTKFGAVFNGNYYCEGENTYDNALRGKYREDELARCSH